VRLQDFLLVGMERVVAEAIVPPVGVLRDDAQQILSPCPPIMTGGIGSGRGSQWAFTTR